MTWREKRKEAYLRTHAHTPRSPKEESKESAVPSGSGDTAAGSTSDDPSTPGSTPREKSFAQKRKEAIIRRQQAGRKPTETDVGVTSVIFAAKLKRLSSSSASKD